MPEPTVLYTKDQIELCLDNGPTYKGWGISYWNGWVCPLFTYDVAVTILNSIGEEWYLSDTVFFIPEFGEIYEPYLVTVDDKPTLVWSIGAWSWVWDRWEQVVGELERVFISYNAVTYLYRDMFNVIQNREARITNEQKAKLIAVLDNNPKYRLEYRGGSDEFCARYGITQPVVANYVRVHHHK